MTGVQFPAESEIWLFETALSRPALRPTQPAIHWVPGTLSPGRRKWSGQAMKLTINYRG